MQSDARKTALQILIKIQARRLPLDLVIDDFQNIINAMNPKDRRLMNAIVYGVLRWRSKLDMVITESSNIPLQKIEPKIKDILRIAIFQLIYLDRVPESAAIHTAVELSKKIGSGQKIAGFVNGVLRKAQETWRGLYNTPKGLPLLSYLSREHAIAEWMLKRWSQRFGEERIEELAISLNRIPSLSLRVNTLLTDRDKLMDILGEKVKTISPNPWLKDAIDFSHPEGAIDRLPGFREGFFQIQDSSAQLATLMLNPQSGEKVLDACAGYGGKTALIAQLMKNKGEILAVDIVDSKLKRLSYEMRRLGVKIVKNRSLDLRRKDSVLTLGRFDRILVDAPCSGMGVIRRNPDIKWNRHEDIFKEYSDRQALLLENLLSVLKPGGLMLYIVCSTENEETMDVVDRFLSAHPEVYIERSFSLFSKEARSFIVDDKFFMPWSHSFQVDGFFALAFKKTGRRKLIN